MAYSRTNTAKQYYNYEVGRSSSSTTDSMKIGLMYVSDYGFAVSPNYWTEAVWDYNDTNLKSNNWLFSEGDEWTISRSTSDAARAFVAYSKGDLYHDGVKYLFELRPSFYLTSSTTYVSGSGSSADPFRIN